MWDGFEDATLAYVTTDRSRAYTNYEYWRRCAPQMREHLVRLSSDLNRVRSNATREMTFFLGLGPDGIAAPEFQASFEFGRACLVELEGRYREQEQQSMEAERRHILAYLAEAEQRQPGAYIEASRLAEDLAINITRTKRQLRLLRNDGLAGLVETIGGGVDAIITDEGHRFLEEGPTGARRGQMQIHIGQVVMGDNLGVQAAGDRQVVIQEQPGTAEVGPLVEAFIAAVNSSGGTAEQKQDAALDAAQLALEARKATPDRQAFLAKVGVLATWAQALSLGPTCAQIVDRIRQIAEALS